MADYIDREVVVNMICEMHVGGQDAVKNALPNTYGADLREIIEEIDALPSADVQPVRHGYWAEENGFIYCPFCGDQWGAPSCESMVKSFNYCPNCGARMNEERKE